MFKDSRGAALLLVTRLRLAIRVLVRTKGTRPELANQWLA